MCTRLKWVLESELWDASFSLVLLGKVWVLVLLLFLGTLVSLGSVISTALVAVVVVTHCGLLSVGG